MATYKELHGTDIEVVTSDPSNPVVGQVWYNTTTEQLKTQRQFVTNAWSTSGNLNTARSDLVGTGSQTAGLAFGGNPSVTASESWDGTSWTEVAEMATGRRELGGCGATGSLDLAFGGNSGSVTGATEEWTAPEANKTITVS